MSHEAEHIVEVDKVTKVFRDFWHRPKVTAVQEISFHIKRGEVFGLLGPNGSGKSTTIKMLLGLLFPTRGNIRVLGQSPRAVKVKERIGYLPEDSYLYAYLTSGETLDFYGQLFDLPSGERRQRIDQLLEMIGLRHARNRVVGEFSKGMARRIGIAQALINDPDFIVLDEPTSGLDPIGCRQIKDLILMLAKRGKTILMTSHLLADVEDVCDRVAILYNGRIQAQGTIDELLEETTRYRITLPPHATGEQAAALVTEGERIVGMRPELDHPRRDLEQFFLQVVEAARNGTEDASGVGRDGGMAGYLRETGDPVSSSPADKHKDIDAELSKLLPPDRPS